MKEIGSKVDDFWKLFKVFSLEARIVDLVGVVELTHVPTGLVVSGGHLRKDSQGWVGRMLTDLPFRKTFADERPGWSTCQSPSLR